MKKAVTLVLGLSLILGGCSKTTEPDRPKPVPEKSITPPDPQKVDWENYNPTVQSGIDQKSAAKDCAGLQAEFDAADANSAAQKALVGDDNADLMRYIDLKLEEAGCYEE